VTRSEIARAKRLREVLAQLDAAVGVA